MNIVPHLFVLSFKNCKIIGTFLYLESREKSNEPIVETLAQMKVTKPQPSNWCIECCNFIGSINIVPLYIRPKPPEFTWAISTSLNVESREESNEPIIENLAQLVAETTVI